MYNYKHYSLIVSRMYLSCATVIYGIQQLIFMNTPRHLLCMHQKCSDNVYDKQYVETLKLSLYKW